MALKTQNPFSPRPGPVAGASHTTGTVPALALIDGGNAVAIGLPVPVRDSAGNPTRMPATTDGVGAAWMAVCDRRSQRPNATPGTSRDVPEYRIADTASFPRVSPYTPRLEDLKAAAGPQLASGRFHSAPIGSSPAFNLIAGEPQHGETRRNAEGGGK